MRTSDIARFYERTGPFLTLYLATRGDAENAGPWLQLRWKNARADLLQRGVPEGVLQAVDPLVEGSHLAGATLALIASVDGVLFSANLPEPPRQEVVTAWATLPSVVPLLAYEQSKVPHVAVLASRAAAELAARTTDGNGGRPVTVEGERSPYLHRSAPGGWSQPRYQHRAEVIWERNAAEVAEVLADMVDRVRPRLVAVAGDVRAVQLLREKSPKRVEELIRVVGGELSSVDAVLQEAARLVDATVERDTAGLLDRFEQERGPHDLAVEGAAETFAALARAQVETLLVGDRPDDERSAWFGEAGQQVALDRDTLLGMGVATPAQGRLVDVATRAALTGGAEVRVLDPDDDRAPSEGLGALLRFATP